MTAQRPLRSDDLRDEIQSTDDGVVSWAQRRGLLATEGTRRCPSCRRPMKRAFRLGTGHRREEGLYLWRCSKCGMERSVRNGTWFEDSNLTLLQIIHITCLFVRQRPQTHAMLDAGHLSRTTIVDWYSFCREVCSVFVERHSQKIGGAGNDRRIRRKQIRQAQVQSWTSGKNKLRFFSRHSLIGAMCFRSKESGSLEASKEAVVNASSKSLQTGLGKHSFPS